MTNDAVRLLETRAALVLAIDHGLYYGNISGLENPEAVLLEGIAQGCDALLVSPGMVPRVRKACGDNLPVPIIVSVDSDFSCAGTSDSAGVIISSIDRAADLGASAVKLLMPTGGSAAMGTVLGRIGRVVDRARDLKIVVVVEPISLDEAPGGRHWESLGDAARVAAEIGADVIKIAFPGQERLRGWVDTLRLPIWILGGDLLGFEESAELVRGAVSGGASGVAMGRNMWGRGVLEMPAVLARFRKILDSAVE